MRVPDSPESTLPPELDWVRVPVRVSVVLVRCTVADTTPSIETEPVIVPVCWVELSEIFPVKVPSFATLRFIEPVDAPPVVKLPE
jgi:hypothetical protein